MSFKSFLNIFLFISFQLLYGNTVSAEETSAIDEKLKNFELNRHSKLLAKIKEPTATLEQFTSDGCSGGLSVGWQYMAGKISAFENIHGGHPPWESCCVNHDKVYHSGALQDDTSSMSYNRRKNADTQLQTCVIETGKIRNSVLLAEYDITEAELETIYQTIGELMYRAVRFGGMPCTGLPWRWGFGWPACLP
jgi:hypothetical protein